jgi:eukaryotic-like serine/threonine-protein kinase
MPYVDGESLRQRLDREGALPIDVAVAITAEVASALDYAHGRGVVHRDIKPENILLQTGQAVVGDFGVARAIDAAATDTARGPAITDTGVMVGTPLYMSPEQITGDPVDARSDVYPLGCVLYEMLAAEPPYTGPTAAAVLARHTLTPAPSVRAVRPEVPEDLERAVTRALAKTPADRFASAGELRAALTERVALQRRGGRWRLGRLAGVAVGIAAVLAVGWGVWRAVRHGGPEAPPPLAVLPFLSLSASPDDQYLADAFTDEVINALARVPGVRVLGRTSTLALQGAHLDSQTLGVRLGAKLLLESSVQRAGPDLRVTTQLVDAASGVAVWSDSYRRQANDLIGVEDEISRAIVGALQVRLAENDGPLVQRGTGSAEAYDLYLKGRYFVNRRGAGRATLMRAIDFYRQALRVDSTYARAWAGLAEAYGFLAGFGDTPPADASLGFIAIFHDWDWDAAGREVGRAIALDSTEPTTHLYRAWYLRCRGHLEEAVAEMRTAQRLDPLNRIFNARVGTLLETLGRYREAEAQLRQAVDLDPDNDQAKSDLVVTLALEGRFQDAIDASPADTTDATPYLLTGGLGYAYARAGRREEALRILHRLERRRAQERYITPEAIAMIDVGLGEDARALDWLEQGYRERSFYLWVIGADPVFYPLRHDPRFQKIVADVGIALSPEFPAT